MRPLRKQHSPAAVIVAACSIGPQLEFFPWRAAERRDADTPSATRARRLRQLRDSAIVHGLQTRREIQRRYYFSRVRFARRVSGRKPGMRLRMFGLLQSFRCLFLYSYFVL